MTITIRQNIQDYDSLSPAAQLILGFIPGGKDWVKDSTGSQAPSYVFSSEGDFLSAVLDGLHNTSLLYIGQIHLLVAPEKLLMLGDKKLDLLAQYLNVGQDDQAIELLKENSLFCNSILHNENQKFLKLCGVASNDLFRVVSLNDLINVYELANSQIISNLKPKSLLKDAGAYAVSLAQTASEFCQLLSFYVTVVDRCRINTSITEQRKSKVEQVYDACSPFANEMLVCPKIVGSTSTEEVNQAIATWIRFGNEFGFASLPAAIEQIAHNIPLDDLRERTLGPEISAYQNQIKEYMQNHSLTDPVLSQDGEILKYRVHNSKPLVQFSLNSSGCLILDNFYDPKESKN